VIAPVTEESTSVPDVSAPSVSTTGKSDDKKPVKVKKVVKELPPRKSGRARKPKNLGADFVSGDDSDDE